MDVEELTRYGSLSEAAKILRARAGRAILLATWLDHANKDGDEYIPPSKDLALKCARGVLKGEIW